MFFDALDLSSLLITLFSVFWKPLNQNWMKKKLGVHIYTHAKKWLSLWKMKKSWFHFRHFGLVFVVNNTFLDILKNIESKLGKKIQGSIFIPMKKIGAVYEKWKKLWKSVEVQTNMKVYFESTHCKLLTSLIIFFPNFIWSWWIIEWKTCKIFHCEENNAQKKQLLMRDTQVCMDPK